MKASNRGTLFMCGTPLGNLEDITVRALNKLKESDVVVCEDTRRTGKLLSHYGIAPRRLVSYHLHSKPGRENEIIRFLLEGSDVVLVSDAGMPGISDPGSRLVAKVWQTGIEVSVLPGVSAITAALAISGFYADRFVFLGFLDRLSNKERKEILQKYSDGETLVLFVSPYKLISTLKELIDNYGDSPVVIARELTKKFEELRRGTLGEQVNYFSENEPRGEFTVIVKPEKKDKKGTYDDSFLKDKIEELEDAGITTKDALKAVSLLYKIPRNKLYSLHLNYSGK